MKNSEQPINPMPYQNNNGAIQHDVYFGLTKREYFAGLALQGFIIAKGKYGLYDESRTHLCQDSLKIADELLKQLEK